MKITLKIDKNLQLLPLKQRHRQSTPGFEKPYSTHYPSSYIQNLHWRVVDQAKAKSMPPGKQRKKAWGKW